MAESHYEDHETPIVLTPNVVGGRLNRCHLPRGGKDGDEMVMSYRDSDEHYVWYASAHAWIVRE